jgi:hypothetical protein
MERRAFIERAKVQKHFEWLRKLIPIERIMQ